MANYLNFLKRIIVFGLVVASLSKNTLVFAQVPSQSNPAPVRYQESERRRQDTRQLRAMNHARLGFEIIRRGNTMMFTCGVNATAVFITLIMDLLPVTSGLDDLLIRPVITDPQVIDYLNRLDGNHCYFDNWGGMVLELFGRSQNCQYPGSRTYSDLSTDIIANELIAPNSRCTIATIRHTDAILTFIGSSPSL